MTTSSSTVDLVGLIDRYAPVQASILQQLEISDIIALSRVCTRLSHVYSTTIKTQYNINDVLKRFFASPIEFRNVQAETDAIICNSGALYFFLRRTFTEEMMVFVRKGYSTAKMQAYLEEDGWSENGESIAREDYDELHYYEKHIPGCSQKAKVTQPCACPRLRLNATCESALSTALVDPVVTEALNIITWSHAYSLLPYPTFILKRSFLMENAVIGSPQRLGRILKTKKHIFDLATEPLDMRDTQHGSPKMAAYSEHVKMLPSRVDYGHRRIGDGHTWTIALNIDGIRQPTKSTLTTTHASFRIVPAFNPAPVRDNHGRHRFTPSYYKICTSILAAPCLKYEYLVDPTDRECPAHSIVPRRYGDISLTQMEALEDEEKPPGWTSGDLSSLLHGWDEFECKVPVGWKWYDDEVEELLRARWDGDDSRGQGVDAE